MLCENAGCQKPIFYPSCFRNEAAYVCTVTYNAIEKDTLHLCESCRNVLRNECKRHGYRFSSKHLAGRR